MDAETERNRIEVRGLKDKLSQVTRKLEEERIQNGSLRSELGRVQKIVAMEVGEEFLTNPNLLRGKEMGGWRGRAQQILTLKEKVRDLSNKLREAEMHHSNETATAKIRLGTPNSVRESKEPRDKVTSNLAIGGLRNIDKRQREQLKNMQSERRVRLDRAMNELQDLQSEHSELRAKYDGCHARNRLLEREVKDLKSKLEVLIHKAQKDDNLIDTLKEEMKKMEGEQLAQKDLAINELKDQLAVQSIEPSVTVNHPESPVPSSQSPQSLSNKGELPSLNAMIQSLTIENKKLRELRGVLERRLADMESQLSEMGALMRRERQKPETNSTLSSGPKSKSQSDKSDKEPKKNAEKNLQDKLDLAMDENEALKATLRAVQEGKEREIRIFQDILEESREIFQRDVQMLLKQCRRQQYDDRQKADGSVE
ncbi:Coiled-coil domain-containing protein 13 [Quaeritorhiza haematococci]|nr:Coiled-coil domain-containing protein 13 [Quaeritorhiza haematococci]